MATREVIEEIWDYLRDVKPAEWDKFRIPQKEYSRIIDNWTRTLSPIPEKVLWTAAICAGRTSGAFIPSAGDLYHKSLELLDTSPGAESVWPLVVKFAGGDDVELPDRAVSVLMKMGGTQGWREADMPFRRQEFMKLYEAERARWQEKAALPGAEVLMLEGKK